MFNKNLKTLRELHGFSQKSMAEKLHIAPTTYRNYENTLREPNFSLLVKIAQTLNTSIDYMLDNSVHSPKAEQILSKLEVLDEESLLMAEKFIDFLIYENKKK